MKSKCLARDWAGNAMSLLNSLMAEEDSGNLAVTLYFTSSQVSRSGGKEYCCLLHAYQEF